MIILTTQINTLLYKRACCEGRIYNLEKIFESYNNFLRYKFYKNIHIIKTSETIASQKSSELVVMDRKCNRKAI